MEARRSRINVVFMSQNSIFNTIQYVRGALRYCSHDSRAFYRGKWLTTHALAFLAPVMIIPF